MNTTLPLGRYPRARASLLPLLLEAQDRDGCLNETNLSAIARHVYVPESEVFGVATSYSELRFEARPAQSIAICNGLSCLVNGALELAQALVATMPGWHIEERPCRFRCDGAPVAAVGGCYVDRATTDGVQTAAEPGASPRTPERVTQLQREGETRRLLRRCGAIDPLNIDEALAAGEYTGWRAASQMAPEVIVEAVADAGLLGRGGAYFPVAAKWRAARSHSEPRYLVVNGEEGEPGVFKDRHLIENDPHLLVEGMLIATRAIQAAAVFIYINGEADLATERLRVAIEAARQRGIIDGLSPPIEIRRGAGGYVCGEESVILSSIEGGRAVPRLRPPFPVEAGLWGRPTVINNVETLCNLPLIIGDGAEAFRSAGTSDYPCTKLVCLSGAIRDPGVYEVPLGTTLRHIVEVIGGGAADGRTLRAALLGGPSGTLLPPSRWNAPYAPNSIDDHGASPGAGGIVLIDDTMTVREVVRHLTAYNAAESCGKCTPCREGTARMVELLDARPADATERLADLAEAIGAASL